MGSLVSNKTRVDETGMKDPQETLASLQLISGRNFPCDLRVKLMRLEPVLHLLQSGQVLVPAVPVTYTAGPHRYMPATTKGQVEQELFLGHDAVLAVRL